MAKGTRTTNKKTTEIINPDINEQEDNSEDMDVDFNLESIDIDLIGELEAQSDAIDNEFTEGNVILSKHSIAGKHALKEDIIFKGKRKEINDEVFIEEDIYNDKFALPVNSTYYEETREPDYYIRKMKLKESIYNILSENNTIDFNKTNRRKPSKVDFNNYYYLAKTKLNEKKYANENFTDVEIFVELAEFFIDNIESMFKLLDDKWRNSIFSELRNYVGKSTDKYEIKKTNLVEGTEVEFEYEDKVINGIIINTDYHNDNYIINSMINIYVLNLCDIKKIVNNSVAHKYNLTKLDNTDFL
jgi:hypothetical protein